jgi:hypothetical protein
MGLRPGAPSRGGPVVTQPFSARINSLGGVAQLVERYVRNVEARGSNPLISTTVSRPPLCRSWL